MTPLLQRQDNAGRIGWRPHAHNPRRAGVRYRCLNPLRELQRMGLQVELYDPARPQRYALVVVQGLSCLDQPQECVASGDRFIDEVRQLKQRGVKILVDDCDNHFHNPGGAPEWTRMAARLRVLLALADGWVASTPQVGAIFEREAGQRRPLAIIGDGLEAASDGRAAWRALLSWRKQRDALRARLFSRAVQAGGPATRLVWFGSHGSSYANGGMLDLLRIRSDIESLGRETALSLTVISNSKAKFDQHIAGWSVPTRYLEWNHVGFSRVLRAHHVALIPVERSAFTDCKTNNRVVTALSHGLAVVADGIPSYQAFGGMAALDDWACGLRRYALDPALRSAHVLAGQALIAQRWTTPAIAAQWRAALEPYLAAAADQPAVGVNVPSQRAATRPAAAFQRATPPG